MREKMGRIRAISISKEKGVKKTNVPSAVLKEGYGLMGDAHAGKWHRQVSLLAQESIEKMKKKGVEVKAGDFAENLTVDCVDLSLLAIGQKIRIARSVILEVTQIGKECHNRCAIYEKVGDCVMPKEGIFAKVVNGGNIFVGDEIYVDGKV